MITDTIVAQCTPVGSGAIALIRVSGIDAVSIVERCSILSSGRQLSDVLSHTIQHGFLVYENKKIDEVLFFVMHAPRTFTGEYTVEITVHNNYSLVQEAIDSLIACGARLAHNGEFSKQAVLNGKIDILQAEAINELIHANSQQQLQQSFAQLKGTFSAWIAELETDVLKIMALCEASFEFLEEDVDFSEQIKQLLNVVLQKIEPLKKTFDIQQQLRNGIRIALIGSVNTGKSSLFNALLGKQRAIVTPIAGTTRDVIEAGLYKKGMYWTLIDTAGLRISDDIVERQGIERSYFEAKTADIILLVWDGSRIITDAEKKIYQALLKTHKNKTIGIVNKSDQLQCKQVLFDEYGKVVCVSTITGDGLDVLEAYIQELIDIQFKKDTSPFLLNKRHFTLLKSFEKQLQDILYLMTASCKEYEIISIHLNDALATLTELTGHSISENMMDMIFKDFCVGK